MLSALIFITTLYLASEIYIVRDNIVGQRLFIEGVKNHFITLAASVSFLFLLPDKEIKLFGYNITEAGARTWPLFLYHRLFTVIIIVVIGKLDFSWLNAFLLKNICHITHQGLTFSDMMQAVYPVGYNLFCSVVHSFVIMILLTSKTFGKLTGWTIKPKWISNKNSGA